MTLAADRASPSTAKRVAGLTVDELRYLDDAIRRADKEGSWLAKVVKSEFEAKKVPEKQQAARHRLRDGQVQEHLHR